MQEKEEKIYRDITERRKREMENNNEDSLDCAENQYRNVSLNMGSWEVKAVEQS